MRSCQMEFDIKSPLSPPFNIWNRKCRYESSFNCMTYLISIVNTKLVTSVPPVTTAVTNRNVKTARSTVHMLSKLQKYIVKYMTLLEVSVCHIWNTKYFLENQALHKLYRISINSLDVISGHAEAEESTLKYFKWTRKWFN